MAKRIVVGISGASGVTYGVRMLELLRKTKFETHLIISKIIKTWPRHSPADPF